MKILNRIAATACLFGAVLLVSCESPDLSTAHESQVNGLLNVTIQIPDNPTEFYATKKGPYEEGEEITVKVPTTDEDPLDVSRLICTVSVEHNCYVVPGVGGEMDFTEPYKITVIDALGNRHDLEMPVSFDNSSRFKPLSLRSSQRRSCMLVAPFMGARSFPVG